MNTLAYLTSKGVSQAGAVDIILGHPIANPSDRAIVERLRPSIAKRSLDASKRPAVPAARSTPPRPGSYLDATLKRLAATNTVWFSTIQVESIRSKGVVSVGGGPLPAIRRGGGVGGGTVNAVLARISQIQARILTLAQQLQAMANELTSLEPPMPPGNNATPQQMAAYQAALDAYQARVEQLQSQIAAIEHELAQLLRELESLQEQDLPAARR